MCEEGPSVRSADPYDGPISGHAQMVDVVSSAADRIPFPPPDPGADGLYRRIVRGMGSGISGAFVARKWQRMKQHINWLELIAVFIAIQLLQFQLRGMSVLFLIDNKTAVFYLKKQGGTKLRALLKLTRRVLMLADSLQITVIPRHITGQLNVLANLAS